MCQKWKLLIGRFLKMTGSAGAAEAACEAHTSSCCICCYRQFQDRQLRNDHGKVQKVLTHTDLVQYLMQKSDGLQEYLAFEGMNQVVFRNAPVPSTV